MAGEQGEAEMELAIRAATGDEIAFIEIVRRYESGLRRLAYRLLGDRDAMDDVLQEAYLKAFRSLRSFRGTASLQTWLYRIVYNACLDQLRRRRREPVIRNAEPAASDATERTDLRLSLAEALAGLRPEERAAVLLVDAEGFSYEEAAEVMHVAAGTVASRLNRARAELRRRLRDAEGVSP